jgi:hypothetical protein
MPIRLTYPLAIFQDMMNQILKDLLNKGRVVDIVDVLIDTPTEEKHHLLVNEVLMRLAHNALIISPEKCIVSGEKVEFEGYVITLDGIEMATDKIEVIKE